MRVAEPQETAIDWTIIHAYERGVDDGFFQGEPNDTYLGPRDELRAAYKQGYDHGVWMYCERRVTVKMKVSELQGAALDWAVAMSEGYEPQIDRGRVWCRPFHESFSHYCPTTDWSQGGPIIERERIRLDPRGVWVAGHDSTNDEYSGTTPLVSAMRCYVASKLGDEIELPEELRA